MARLVTAPRPAAPRGTSPAAAMNKLNMPNILY
jgi:hypothetical protein